MHTSNRARLWTALALLVALGACSDAAPTASGAGDATVSSASGALGQGANSQFARSVPEVMAVPGAVFAGTDPATGQLLVGVEHPGVANSVASIMARHGIPAARFRVRVTEPIHFAATLRDEIRPIVSGLQIHWSSFVCTLGFSVDHAGGRSFVTNSHCTDQQGQTDGTQYNQPSRTTSPTPIAFEVDDPAFTRGGGCSQGKKCRKSDASRALYESGVESFARIARTTGENNGSLEIAGDFAITGQDNSSTSFSGTFHKVGRTTGWTSGNVTATCATVNVSGSQFQLLCQTLVQRTGTAIVGGGDSGSPVFAPNGSGATLVGILWGGSTSGDLFVFSPLKSIQDELGAMNALTDGVGTGGGGGGGGGEEPNCPPNSNKPACR